MRLERKEQECDELKNKLEKYESNKKDNMLRDLPKKNNNNNLISTSNIIIPTAEHDLKAKPQGDDINNNIQIQNTPSVKSSALV